MKLWLDDVRNPFTYGQYFVDSTRASIVLNQYGRDGWIWVKTVEEAKEILLREHVTILSCDNDLGPDLAEGYTLLDWIEEQAFLDSNFDIPDNIFFHSANTALWTSAEATIKNIYRFKRDA